ncbi:MMPL/RND family transporter [Mycobacterium tilburgii]|uniref:hypothetical protein n=1 Tax=Mycobacterium tilburgii TaxID=44467 RepID=UPI00389918F0
MVVRWHLPVLAASCALALVGLVTLPGYTASYNDRAFLPTSLPANQGFAAADRHISQARLKPEVLLIEEDHDLRNPTDTLILDRLAKGVFRVPGIARVQGITRPDGTTMDHTPIPFQLSMQNAGQLQTMKYQRGRMNDLLKEADDLQQSIDALQRVYGITAQTATVTHDMDGVTHKMVHATDQLRDNIAAAEESLKGTSLEDAKIYVAGTAAVVQRHFRRRQLRPHHRRSFRAVPHFRNHADPHSGIRLRRRHRGHRRVFL